MRETARWMLVTLLACLLVPCAWATVEVAVVDVDGTEYRVAEGTSDGGSSEPISLTYTVTSPGGSIEEGVISPTGDPSTDRDPRLALLPNGAGPILVWTRNDGAFDQIAYSRFSGNAWSSPTYMTMEARHHEKPAMGIDGTGMGVLLWTELGGAGRVMYASFEPSTGVLVTSPRSLQQELLLSGPPEWLTQERPGREGRGRSPSMLTPDGGNDAPAVPPASQNPSETDGEVITLGNCPRVAVAITHNKDIQIGVMENGSAVRYFRSVTPIGASEDYLGLFLTGVLQQSCQ